MYSIPGFHDPVSAMTHLLGAGLFGALAVVLLCRGRGDRWRVLSLAVYSFTCIFLLAMSGVNHLLAPGAGRAVLARLDHAAIFALIAGTFTPIHTIMFRGFNRWGPLLFVWTAAAAGISLKTIYFTSIPYWLGVMLYLTLGWVGLLSGIMLGRHYGRAAVAWPLWGGLAYTFGALLEFLNEPRLIPGVVGPHELFHIAVLVGMTCHWTFIFEIAGRHDEPPRGAKHD